MKKLKRWGGDDAPEYCWACGRKLKVKNIFLGYNERTGAVRIGKKLYCPFLFGMHKSLKFNDEGEEIIEYEY